MKIRFVRLLILLAAASGCGGGLGVASLELSGPEARGRLPESVAGLIPEGAILCLDEERHDGALHQWILRDPAGTWLAFPAGKGGPERHDMPPSALETILASRLPGLDRGTPREKRCRYTHWTAPDGAEIQVREILTDRGWFASVERVRM
ncbi:hypothetical protein TA3x_001667 [Tundrisphaera sp. TA3]|uniref:hypothetical protein n=1 Tax=Tundrisphaera sp. TA3 TaxID=3435775 RepID=UPI003EB9BBE0